MKDILMTMSGEYKKMPVYKKTVLLFISQKSNASVTFNLFSYSFVEAIFLIILNTKLLQNIQFNTVSLNFHNFSGVGLIPGRCLNGSLACKKGLKGV